MLWWMPSQNTLIDLFVDCCISSEICSVLRQMPSQSILMHFQMCLYILGGIFSVTEDLQEVFVFLFRRLYLIGGAY